MLHSVIFHEACRLIHFHSLIHNSLEHQPDLASTTSTSIHTTSLFSARSHFSTSHPCSILRSSPRSTQPFLTLRLLCSLLTQIQLYFYRDPSLPCSHTAPAISLPTLLTALPHHLYHSSVDTAHISAISRVRVHVYNSMMAQANEPPATTDNAAQSVLDDLRNKLQAGELDMQRLAGENDLLLSQLGHIRNISQTRRRRINELQAKLADEKSRLLERKYMSQRLRRTTKRC